MAAHRVELLALENDIFERSTSRASYMGHWMNLLPKLESCACLADVFHEPEQTSTVEKSPSDEASVVEAAAECPQTELSVSLFGSPLGSEEEKANSSPAHKQSSPLIGNDKHTKQPLSSSSSSALSGKPMLAGAELPFSLFGSPLGAEAVEPAETEATLSISADNLKRPSTDIEEKKTMSSVSQKPISMPEAPRDKDPSGTSSPTNEEEESPSLNALFSGQDSSGAIPGAPKGFCICRDFVSEVIQTRLDPLCKFKVVERDVAELISKKCLDKVLGIKEGAESRLAAWTRWEVLQPEQARSSQCTLC